jgi:probable phosphoglycerate mutase
MAVSTELVLVRHGQATCNVAGIVGGPRGCTGLTPTGRAQVTRLAERLAYLHARRPFDAAYTTPRLRVRQSADIITARLGIEATQVEELRGLDHGDADGQPWHQVKTAFAGPPQHRPDRPIAPGAETWNAHLDRVTTTLTTIVDRHVGDSVLIIGHGETIEAANAWLLHLPRDGQAPGFITDHACLTHWQQHVNRFARTVWMLAAHNDTSHLPTGGQP